MWADSVNDRPYNSPNSKLLAPSTLYTFHLWCCKCCKAGSKWQLWSLRRSILGPGGDWFKWSSEGNIAPTTGPAWPWNIAEKPTHYWKLPKKDQRIGAPNHFSHATANCWQEGETNLKGQHQSNISLKQIFSRHIFYLLPKSRPNLSGILRLEARSGKTHIFGPRFLLRYLSPMPNKNPSITKSCDLSFSAAARVARTFWCTAHLIWPRGSIWCTACGHWLLTIITKTHSQS